MADEKKKDFFEETNEVDENDVDIITLHNIEKDVDEDFYHLATFDCDGKWYVGLLPTKPEKGEEDEVYIFRIEEGKNENMIVSIDDEAEIERAFAEFSKFMEENTPDEDNK